MATPGSVQRTAEIGDVFRTFDSGGAKSQAVALVDENLAHTGVPGNALLVEATTALPIDDSTPIDVAITGQPIQTTGAVETFVRFKSTGFVDSIANIAAGACELRQLRAIISSTETSPLYLQWFALTAVPVDTTAADWEMLVPINGEASETFLKGEMALTPGCSFAVSTTPDVLTITSSSAMKIYGVRV